MSPRVVRQDTPWASLFVFLLASHAIMPDQSRHVVIVGGGIIGASIAYFMSRRSDCPKVTLLESSKTLAPGASGKAGGFLALDWHGTSTASLAALSFELHLSLIHI